MRSASLICACYFVCACTSAAEQSAVGGATSYAKSAELFISPMGEPFRAAAKGKRLPLIWFAKADLDSNHRLSIVEMQADADRFFAWIDADASGAIEPHEMVSYEKDIAPEIRVAW